MVASNVEQLLKAPEIEGPLTQVFNVKQGQVRGQVLKSINGRQYFAFRGIPYAKTTNWFA